MILATSTFQPSQAVAAAVNNNKINDFILSNFLVPAVGLTVDNTIKSIFNCNMWNREGYQYQKQSYKGITFNFQDGDYVIYYANKNVNEDWTSSGTH